MGSLTTFGRNKMVDHLLGTAYTPAATLYLALCTADPTVAATGASMNEVANAGAYQRVAITFGAAASRRVTQSGAVNFPQATAGWGTVSHWAVVDSGTYGAGNVLAIGAFSPSKTIVVDNTPTVGTGVVYVEVSAGKASNYAANGFLDRMFRNQAFTVSANYAGLATATIADSDTGSTVTEPSGNNYSRVQVNLAGGASPAWAAASAGAASNAQQIDMPNPSGSWGTPVSSFIADAASAGNLLLYDNDTVDQAVGNGDTVYYPAGDWDVSVS